MWQSLFGAAPRDGRGVPVAGPESKRSMGRSFFQFGGFQLESERRALYYRGVRVSVTPKDLDLLLYLVRFAGRMVTKDELIYNLWATEGISDANLAQVVYRVRKVLAQYGAGAEYISTIPGQGYQFVADVVSDPGLAAHPAGKKVSEQAFQAYRNARYLLSLRTGTAMKRSIDLFRRALELEHDYAAAHVGIAEAYAFLGEYLYLPASIAFPQAKESALQALDIDRNCAEAHSALGEVLLFYDRDLDAARIAYQAALSIAPFSITARLLSAWHALFAEEGDHAIAQLEAALQIDPASVLLNTTLGAVRFYLRSYEGAKSALLDVLEFAPESALAKFSLGQVLLMEREWEEAVTVLESGASQEYQIQTEALIGYGLAQSGRRDAALEKLAFLEKPGGGRVISQFNRALVLTGLGDAPSALAALQAACDDSDPWLPFVAIHPLFDDLENEIGFAKVKRRIRGY